jgi:hypothetical protein
VDRCGHRNHPGGGRRPAGVPASHTATRDRSYGWRRHLDYRSSISGARFVTVPVPVARWRSTPTPLVPAPLPVVPLVPGPPIPVCPVSGGNVVRWSLSSAQPAPRNANAINTSIPFILYHPWRSCILNRASTPVTVYSLNSSFPLPISIPVNNGAPTVTGGEPQWCRDICEPRCRADTGGAPVA